MDHDSEKSHDEAREGHELRNEHAHAHAKHMKNTSGGAEKKHVSQGDAAPPGEEHRDGALLDEKK